MARKSSVELLPAALREQVNRMIGEQSWTLDQITEYLREAGNPVSRSAVGRHKQRMDAFAARMRQSREATEAVARAMGDDAVQGERGRVLVQTLQVMTMEIMARLDEEGEVSPKDLAALARTAAQLSLTKRRDQDYETNLRDQLAAEQAAALDASEAAGDIDAAAANAARRALGFA